MKRKKGKKDGPLKSPGKEKFCKLYAGAFWGDGKGAAEKAGFADPARRAEALLADPAVIERIRYYRKLRSEMSLADEAWIKETFIHIVKESEKDSDRLRALAGLQKYAGDNNSIPEGRTEENSDADESPSAFFFDGEETAIL